MMIYNAWLVALFFLGFIVWLHDEGLLIPVLVGLFFIIVVACYFIGRGPSKKKSAKKNNSNANGHQDEHVGGGVNYSFIKINRDHKFCLLTLEVLCDLELDTFFESIYQILKKMKIKCILDTNVFEQIRKARRSNDYDSVPGKMARAALSRIDNLQKNGILLIEDVCPASAVGRNDFALSLAKEFCEKYGKSFVLTTDLELKVVLVARGELNNCDVFTPDSFKSFS